MEGNLTPLILDLAEPIGETHDKNGEQIFFGITTVGPPPDIDAGGYD